jgi:hypothetical protein
MIRLVFLVSLTLLNPVSVFAQATAGKTIEGYWQDIGRRILFSQDAPASYVYGQWTILDQQQTYPSAKHIRNSGARFELLDLLYDDDEVIKVLKASEESIEFTRTTRWSGCSVHHRCGVEQDQMLCSLQTTCPNSGGERVVWRGEERYARRGGCERQQKGREAQGIPVVCR